MVEYAYYVARYFVKLNELGGEGSEHKNGVVVLRRFLEVELELQLVDCDLGPDAEPDACGYYWHDSNYKVLAEVKAAEDSGDTKAKERLRKYLSRAQEGISRDQDRWTGFLFVLAITRDEYVEGWNAELIRIAREEGFSDIIPKQKRYESLTLLLWDWDASR